MITEDNLINWLRFMRVIIPNKEDKKLITKFLKNHTDDRDDNTGKNTYASHRLYRKYWS